MTGVPIKGAKELSDHLKTLGPKVEKKVLRQAVVAGAKVFRDRARRKAQGLALAPEARGRLRRAIRHKRERGKPGVVIAGLFIASIPKKTKGEKGARTVDDPQVWALWVDKGTAERFRGGKRAKRLRATTGSRMGYSGKMPAQPFLEPTFDEAQGEALDAVIDYARERLEREAGSKP